MKKNKYPCSQASLYAICRRAWQLCRIHQAAFFAFDAKYTLVYIDSHIALINAAEGLPDIKVRKENFSLLSIEYDKVATHLALLAQYLKGYIEYAYRKDKAVLKVMLTTAGFDHYAKVQDFDDKAIAPFMNAALKFIADKADIMSAEGKMPADFAARFTAADTAFDDVLESYDTAKSDLSTKADEKVDANNDIYDALQDMLYVGRFIHLEMPERAKDFVFNTLWEKVEPTKNAGVNGKTMAVGGKKSLIGITITEILTGKTATSDKEGSYNIGPLSEGKYTLLFSAAGYVSQTIEVVITKGVMKRLNVEMVAV